MKGTRRSVCWLAAVVIAAGSAPTIAGATIMFDYGGCGHAASGLDDHPACDQNVQFSPANNGVTVKGKLAPPTPDYDVTVTSLEGITLHGSGANVDTGVQGPGMLSVIIRPEAGWGWKAIDFTLDSDQNAQNGGTAIGNGVTFTALDQFGTSYTGGVFDLPWEGNQGANQHYHAWARDDQLIVSLTLTYDPGTTGNTIETVHHLSVYSVQVPPLPFPAPEPAPLALLGLGLASLALLRRRVR